MGETRNAYKILVGKYEKKRLLGKPRLIRKQNIKMDLKETGKKEVKVQLQSFTTTRDCENSSGLQTSIPSAIFVRGDTEMSDGASCSRNELMTC